jgi:hypothetical protein
MNILPSGATCLLAHINDDLSINAKATFAQELAEREEKKKEKKPVEQLVPEEYHEFLKVFSKEEVARFPKSGKWDHKIELKPDFQTKAFKHYSLTPQEQEEMKKFLNENKKKGYIRESKSPMASPMFFVKKKDGKLRPCQDYQYLNEGTIKNAYPLLLISALLDKLKGAKYFTKFDVRWGYNNIQIHEGDQWKTAFTTPFGLYECLVMFFGLCNSPATSQNFMNHLFIKEINRGFVIVYMDDILIFANTKKELANYTRRVLQILKDNDLYLKLEKCEFAQEKIAYLGLIVEHGKLSMDPVKIAGLKDWPTPTTVKEVQSFLGFGNFYRKFIKGYLEITASMNNLLQKEQKWE